MTTATLSLPTTTATETIAVLPYWPVWAAAQFASRDAAKQLLNFVHVCHDGDTLQIESTDGHRAFRYRFPVGRSWNIPDAGLLLLAKPLQRAVAYGQVLLVSDDMQATFLGGKANRGSADVPLDRLSSVNLAGFYSVYHAADCGKVGTYPKINQLWPDTFKNEPGRRFAFNARYVREWCAVVEKLSINNVTVCECNAPTTPFCWSATVEFPVGDHAEKAQIDYLLMPVQVRV